MKRTTNGRRRVIEASKAETMRIIGMVRKRTGLSNRKLAELIGYSYSLTLAWQREDLPNTPSIATLAKIAALAR
jgi:transcriptional regulator with XRE-family HTH domain